MQSPCWYRLHIVLGKFKYDFEQALARLCISSNGGVCSNVITKVQKKTNLVFHGIDKGKGQLISKCLFGVFNPSKK